MRNNIPIVGLNPKKEGQPIIRIEVRFTPDKEFVSDIFLVNSSGGGQGWDKMTIKPEATPDCSLLAAHLAVIRKLSQPPPDAQQADLTHPTDLQ